MAIMDIPTIMDTMDTITEKEKRNLWQRLKLKRHQKHGAMDIIMDITDTPTTMDTMDIMDTMDTITEREKLSLWLKQSLKHGDMDHYGYHYPYYHGYHHGYHG